MNNEPLPQIHLIRDTDLITFAYELHIFAGDFLRESEFNIHSLVTNTGTDSVAIMGKNHMWLSDALHAYCSTADLHQMIFTTEYIGARAFLFHTDRKEDGRLYGDVMMLDLDTLRQDVKRNTLSPYGVDIYRPNGRMETVSLEKWHSMELCEKDALKSWGFCYRPEQVTEWQHHYSGMFSQWKEQAFSYFTMKKDYEAVIAKLSDEISTLENGLAVMDAQLAKYKELEQDAKVLEKDHTLTAALIDRLIERIEITHDKEIRVSFRFKSEFEEYGKAVEQCRNL